MAIADRHGLPVSATIAEGQRNEVALVDSTLQARFTKAKPKRLIADRAYDSAKLDNGSMWPVAYALPKLTAADEKKIRALVKQAVS